MFRKGGHTTAMVANGRKKVHTTFENGAELIEEYDIKTGELMVRKRRGKSTTGREGDWEFLYGEPQESFNPEGQSMRESSLNPQFSRCDLRHAFQWRVRNLPYPSDVYAISIDHAERKIIIRTTNKKYFRRFPIPELDALGLALDERLLSWSHANNTLLLAYTKPPPVLAAEQADLQEVMRVRAQDGDVDCKQQ